MVHGLGALPAPRRAATYARRDLPHAPGDGAHDRFHTTNLRGARLGVSITHKEMKLCLCTNS